MELSRIDRRLLTGAVVVVVAAAYWQSLALPFIQDDWGFLRFVQTHDYRTVLGSFFSRGSSVLYRPFGQSYLYAMYRLFGANALAFHIAALTVHVANSCLVGLIITAVTRDRIVGQVTALVFAAAVAIHLDSLAWVVGIYDLGGTFFFLLALWLFLESRPIASACCYLSGCLFKESVVILPLILICLPLLEGTDDWARTLRNRWQNYAPTLVAALLLVLLKISGNSLLDVPPDYPYAIRLIGPHVIHHALVYPAYMFQSLFPFLSITQHAFQILMVIMVAVLIFALTVTVRRGQLAVQRGTILFLLIWQIAGLLPVLFLPNHIYRYYATISLPAFVAFIFLLFKDVLLSFRIRAASVVVAMYVVCALATACSIMQANRIYREGLVQSTLVDGTNQLIKRAATVGIARDTLLRDLPTDPAHACIVFGGADIWAFDRNSGPQYWFDDGSINVYSLNDLRYREGRFYVEHPKQSQLDTTFQSRTRDVLLDAPRILAYQLSSGHLRRLTLQELQASVARVARQ